MRLTRSLLRRSPRRRGGAVRPRRGHVAESLRPARRARRTRLHASRSCTTTTAIPRMSFAAAGWQACLRRTLVVQVGAAVVVLAVPVWTAHAESVTVLAQVQSVDQVLTNIRNWLMGILALLATVVFTVGGVRRVMAGGDPGEHEKSKDCFKAAAIGYGLAALAPLIVSVLKGIVGA